MRTEMLGYQTGMRMIGNEVNQKYKDHLCDARISKTPGSERQMLGG